MSAANKETRISPFTKLAPVSNTAEKERALAAVRQIGGKFSTYFAWTVF